MSLLLDALNKADQERKRNEAVPGINSNHDGAPEHRAHASPALIVAITFAAAIAIAAAVFFWFNSRQQPAPQVPAVASARVAIPPKTTASSTEPLITPTNVQASVPASQENIASTPSAEETPADDSVASLYQQKEAPIKPETQAEQPNANQPMISPTPGTGNQSIAQFSNIPDINELPQNMLSKIPSLNYSQHNYNNVGGSVVINGVIRRPNDQIANGIILERILQDGIILHMDTFSFKMRALNSWLNM